MDEKPAEVAEEATSVDEMTELLKAQYESAEVEGITSCTHISKCVDPRAPKEAKKATNGALALCATCIRVGDGRQKKTNSEDPSDGFVTMNGINGLTDDIWVCMCCAYTACGRNFANLHAAEHALAKNHWIAVQPFKRWVWCYKCDDFIAPDATPKLVDMMKQMKPHLDKFVKRYEERTGEKAMPPPEPPTETGDVTVVVPMAKENGKPLTRSTKQGQSPVMKNGVALAGATSVARGLSNLGNTCFYNSAIQNVIHTHVLVALIRHLQTTAGEHHYKINLQPSPQPVLNEDGTHKAHVEYPPISIELTDYDGDIAYELTRLVTTYHQGDGVVKPSGLFNVISQQVPRFRGYQQQDSHELLRYLIDGMRTYRHEELRKTIAAKLGHPYPWPKKLKDTPEIRAMKEKSRAYFHSANVTPIDRVFGGTLLQTIQCTVCRHISTRIEPFLDLSLSICDKNRLAEKEEQLSARLQPTPVITSQPGAVFTADNITCTSDEEDEPMVVAANTSIESMNIEDDDDKPSAVRTTSRKVYGSMSQEDDYQEGLQRLLERLATSSTNDGDCTIGTCLDAFTQRELLQGDNKFGCTNCFNNDRKLLEKTSRLAENCCPGSPVQSSSSAEDDEEKTERRGTRNNPAPIKPPKPTKSNKYKYVDAIKRYIIIRPPPVLAVHLKRFIKRGWQYSKNSAQVDFPARLDLAPWMCKFSENISTSSCIYELTGIVTHSGSIGGGHYVCSVRARDMDTTPEGIERVLRFVDMNMKGDGNRCEVDRQMLTAMLNRHVTSPKAALTDELEGRWYSISDSNVMSSTLERVLRQEAYVLFYERVL